MGFAKKISAAAQLCGASFKSLVKLAVESKKCGISKVASPTDTLIIMGNGPALAIAMNNDADILQQHKLMAVNFAANADEFYQFRPKSYVLADPLFFTGQDLENVARLWRNFAERIDWPMTLFIPAKMKSKVPQFPNGNISIETFNPVGVEGFYWLENAAYSSGRGMPRPRNVLIVAIMIGLKMGFRNIYLTGADHSWTKTLAVDDNNMVVTIQPHFYKDNEAEHSRVASVYKDIRLHEILLSFHIAFRSYFFVRRFADKIGASIFNATPDSFIDAFPRRPLSSLRK